MIADLVESVRLFQLDERGVIDRWIRFVSDVQVSLQADGHGRVVKSLGDGLLLEFQDVADAAAFSQQLHEMLAPHNCDVAPDLLFALRVGVHVADVVIESLDVYGAGVNLAARLAGLARPGSTVISVEVRDLLADGVHGTFDDLGECYLKHYPNPVRAFRLCPANAHEGPKLPEQNDHSAVLAVIPFQPIDAELGYSAIGEAIADDVIASLSRLDGLRLIARLSTSPLQSGLGKLDECHRLLNARYVLSGQYMRHESTVRVRATLSDCRNGQVLWSGGKTLTVASLFDSECGAAIEIANEVARSIVGKEIQRARANPLETLDNFALYIGGVTLMHRMSAVAFARSHELLEHLFQRLPRSAEPPAILAKWHLMRMLQGWSPDADADGKFSLQFARQALDRDPEHAFALATEGMVAAHVNGDLALARRRCEEALNSDPQEAAAWRMAAGVYSYLGDGDAAQRCAGRAISLTPLDPTRFIYDLIMGASKLAAGQPQQALDWADASIRRNALHVPSHRLRVLALALIGRGAEAQAAGKELLRLAPLFRVGTYLSKYPGRDQPHAAEYATALRSAGIPS